MSHETFTHMELERKAAEVLLHFDFEKVLAHMQSVDWRWAKDDGSSAVPTLDELQALARSLLTQAIWHKDSVVNLGSGGLWAYKLPWGLQLTFSITWSHC